MQLHNLISIEKRKSKKRVGRGGKRGTYSGRGIKGQKSRAGRRIRQAERDLIIRLPKKRGFKNKPTSPKSLVLNLKTVIAKLNPIPKKEKPAIIDRNLLSQAGLIPKKYKGDIKILGNHDIKIAVALKGLKFSKSVKIKIEKAGGSTS